MSELEMIGGGGSFAVYACKDGVGCIVDESAQQYVHPTLPKAARVEPDPLGMDIADPTPDSP